MNIRLDYIKKNKWLIVIVFVLGGIVGYVINSTPHQQITTSTDHHIEQSENQQWTCSMHPQIKKDKEGLCPICAMDLVSMATNAIEGEHVDVNEIQMTKSALALASVQTVIVRQGVPEKDVQLLGKIKADERNIAKLTARFGGRIEDLFINFTGQKVRKGEKLGTIYSPKLITAQKELLEAIKYKKNNPSLYKASRAKLKLWDLTEQQIDGIESRGKIKTYFDIQSPISGTVSKKYISIGDYVKEGSSLFEVINLSKVWVLFNAYESDLPWITKGDHVAFTIPSIPGVQFNSKVTFIDPFINAKTRVAKVRVELNNQNGQLKPEMFVNGILKSNSAINTQELLIPKSSILWTGKRAVVYVKVPDRETSSFLYREIVLGPEAGGFYIVKEGLLQGEEIAMNGVFKIDAAAQLAGKLSMMNTGGGENAMAHNHGEMGMSRGETEQAVTKLQHEIFPVSGNCSMCKSTIEKAVKSLPGIGMANWNVETKELQVSFDDGLGSLTDIHKAIAKSGYDTKLEKATEETYDKLPPCCQYTR